MRSQRAVLELIGVTRDAAGGETRWPVCRGRLTKVLKSPTINLAVEDFSPAEGRNNFDLGSVGLDPGFYRAYPDHYEARKPMLIRGGRLLKQGDVYRHSDFCPPGGIDSNGVLQPLAEVAVDEPCLVRDCAQGKTAHTIHKRRSIPRGACVPRGRSRPAPPASSRPGFSPSTVGEDTDGPQKTGVLILDIARVTDYGSLGCVIAC